MPSFEGYLSEGTDWKRIGSYKLAWSHLGGPYEAEDVELLDAIEITLPEEEISPPMMASYPHPTPFVVGFFNMLRKLPCVD